MEATLRRVIVGYVPVSTAELRGGDTLKVTGLDRLS
jgi:hypothetical protein